MVTRELPRDSWAAYLERLTIELYNAPVTIEVTDPQEEVTITRREATRMALQALAFDQRDEVFEVSVARGGPHLPTVLRHLVDHPARIEVDGPVAITPRFLAVLGEAGVRTVVRISPEGEFSG